MEVYKVDPESVIVGDRMRRVDPERVHALAASMKSLGLQTPISVWSSDDGEDVHLIAGAHRLAAAIELGWDEIECSLVTMSEIDRKRWEIAENLHRSELTALERDEHVAEWIRLTEESDKLAQVAPVSSKGGRGKESGTRKAARDLGIDRDDARRAVKVASLSEEAKAVAREVGLADNRSALLSAASQPVDRQAEEVRRIAERKAIERSAQRELSRIAADLESTTWTADDEGTYANLLDAWDAATPAAKAQFLREHARRQAA